MHEWNTLLLLKFLEKLCFFCKALIWYLNWKHIHNISCHVRLLWCIYFSILYQTACQNFALPLNTYEWQLLIPATTSFGAANTSYSSHCCNSRAHSIWRFPVSIRVSRFITRISFVLPLWQLSSPVASIAASCKTRLIVINEINDEDYIIVFRKW